MKYFIAFLGFVFLLFIGLIGYGRSLPQTFVFEKSIAVSSDVEDIYEEMVAADRIRMWAPYVAGLGRDNTAITGSERGSGQLLDWRNAQAPFESGLQEVLAITPPYFVQSRFSSASYDGSIIYALNESLPTDDVTVLIRLDLDAGGAPFFNRVKLRLKQELINEELEQALARLKTITEK